MRKGGEKIMMKRLMNRKAFTLIELVLVLVIIGVLAAILIPALSMRDKANISKAKGEIRSLHAGALGYLSAGRTTFTGVSVANLVSEGHLPANFTGTGSNPWGGDYTVTVNASDATQVDIALTTVPANAGADLVRTFNTISEGATYATTTFTVTF